MLTNNVKRLGRERASTQVPITLNEEKAINVTTSANEHHLLMYYIAEEHLLPGLNSPYLNAYKEIKSLRSI